MMEGIIKVWRFEDAPQEYQDLSGHGGDEDYVIAAFGSYAQDNDYVPEMLAKHLMICDYEVHTLLDAMVKVFITAHA